MPRVSGAPRPMLRAGNAPRAQDAYAYLLTELLEGTLGPGDWLSIVDIAATLDCSRVPVMEAIKRLAGEGFLTILPQVGCRVVVPDPAEIHDFFTLFAAVEGCISRLAAERRTAADLVEFRETCAQVDRLLKQAGGPAARDPVYRHANTLFHAHLHRLARAPSACAIAAGLWDRSDFYIKVAFGSLYFSRRVRQAHVAIRRAIVAGDPDGAERAVELHLRAVGSDVSARLAARG
ncbi:MAG: GntR family transcriptional regulator [Gammaproteobacteria bacterium]